jgi:hypothetical protein
MKRGIGRVVGSDDRVTALRRAMEEAMMRRRR